jgi:hypothetical protein
MLFYGTAAFCSDWMGNGPGLAAPTAAQARPWYRRLFGG